MKKILLAITIPTILFIGLLELSLAFFSNSIVQVDGTDQELQKKYQERIIILEKFLSERDQNYLTLATKNFRLDPYRGFMSNTVPGDYEVSKIPKGNFHVGIMGGSVACNFYLHYKDILARSLVISFPELSSRSVTISPVCSGDFKQPQQINDLMFKIISGARYDVLIAIDGYNEVAGTLYNHMVGANPFFPNGRTTSALLDSIAGAPFPSKTKIQHTLFETQKTELSFLKFTQMSFLKNTNIFGVATELGYQFFSRKYKNLELELERILLANMEAFKASAVDSANVRYGIYFMGPSYSNVTEIEELIADYWERTSSYAGSISELEGIELIHFLQPTLLDKNAKKTLTEKEAQILTEVKNSSPIISRWVKSFDALKSRANKPQINAFDVVDLTAIFSDVEEQTFIDSVHFTSLGRQIFFENVMENLRRRINNSNQFSFDMKAVEPRTNPKVPHLRIVPSSKGVAYVRTNLKNLELIAGRSVVLTAMVKSQNTFPASIRVDLQAALSDTTIDCGYVGKAIAKNLEGNNSDPTYYETSTGITDFQKCFDTGAGILLSSEESYFNTKNWEEISIISDIPTNVTNAFLTLSAQSETTAPVYFDDIRLFVKSGDELLDVTKQIFANSEFNNLASISNDPSNQSSNIPEGYSFFQSGLGGSADLTSEFATK